MQRYSQSSGKWTNAGGAVLGTGYSGIGAGLNNSAMQHVQGQGPIPQGLYTIEPPKDDAQTGPHSMPLAPDPANQMFGRSAFLIHGDTAAMDHVASHGCIILGPGIRRAIWTEGDPRLTVTA